MAITRTCHVESVAGSGVASVVVTCQRVEEPRSIRRRKWSRIKAIIVVYQGVMEPCGIRCRKWSRVMAVTVACQGVMELRKIHYRKWSRVVAVTAACQVVQACRSKFGWGVWWREVAGYPPEKSSDATNPIGCLGRARTTCRRSSESGSRKSLGEVFP